MGTLKLKKKVPAWRKNFRRNEKVDLDRVDRMMAKAYPHLFSNPVPLEIGIREKLLEHPELPVSRTQCRRFLQRWCHSKAYLQAVRNGKERIGIKGEKCRS